jgi:hypothetical protein
MLKAVMQQLDCRHGVSVEEGHNERKNLREGNEGRVEGARGTCQDLQVVRLGIMVDGTYGWMACLER